MLSAAGMKKEERGEVLAAFLFNNAPQDRHTLHVMDLNLYLRLQPVHQNTLFGNEIRDVA